MPKTKPSYAVVCCMRNEAIFLLEWLAYQLVVGFDTVAVITNDCTDGTDLILDEIADRDDRVLHIRNRIAPGEAPQVAGMRLAMAAPRLREADYLLHCDADEFLHVARGAGRVEDLMQPLGDVDCVALAWRPFGDNGHRKWPGGLVLENCTRADNRPHSAAVLHKSIFRPTRFARAIEHMPKDPVSADVRLVNARGEALEARSLSHPTHARFRGMGVKQITWTPACIHHYAIRSEDVFLMKNDRGDGMALETRKYFINSQFWRRCNRNSVEVPEAQQHIVALRRVLDELRAPKRVARLEAQAFEAFCRRRDALLVPEQIDAWTENRAETEEKPVA